MKTIEKDFKGTNALYELRGNQVFVTKTYVSICTVHVKNNWDLLKGVPIVDIEAKANEKLLTNSLKNLQVLQAIRDFKIDEGQSYQSVVAELRKLADEALNESI